MAEVFDFLIKLTSDNPLMAFLAILFALFFMLILCVPSIFCFFVFREFKSVAVEIAAQFIEKLDSVVHGLEKLTNEVTSVKENIIKHQNVVDMRFHDLSRKRNQ